MARIPLLKSHLEEIAKRYKPKQASCFLPVSQYKPKQIQNAIKSYAPDVKPEHVVLLLDRTVFGGAKDGFLVTRTHLYGDMMKGRSVDLNRINNIEFRKDSLIVRYLDGKEEQFYLHDFTVDIYNYLLVVKNTSEKLQEIAPQRCEELLDKGMEAFGKKDYATAKAAFREAAYYGSELARRYLTQLETAGF